MLDQIGHGYRGWRDRNFPTPCRERQFQKFVEEVGELGAALYRDDTGAVLDALGDIFLSWLGLCHTLLMDPSCAAWNAWLQVKARDYVTYPKNGRTE